MGDAIRGLLFIGDPHVASRPPGFRKDDYPSAILRKLRWAMDYAREHGLVPVLLGDLFDFPRDNANWVLVELLHLLKETLAICGNHDCKENALGENDTLSVLEAAGAVRLLDRSGPWAGVIGGRVVLVGGTSWGQKLPKSFDRAPAGEGADGERRALVCWVCHHDLRFPGYEDSARFDCKEIPGIDLVVNGHIHRDLGEVRCGGTLWINPGNIARVSRSDASRRHVPSVLRVDVTVDGYECRRVAVPHEPFEAVFHEGVSAEQVAAGEQSAFVRELAALESVRTASGAGLMTFLDANLPRFDPRVAEEIRSLAKEVLEHAD
jgi:DNA repair exonuclease SbcCD nuclease subunit